MSSLSHGSIPQPLCWDGSASPPANRQSHSKRDRQPSAILSAEIAAEQTRIRTADRVSRLARTIETEIIPRLLLANSAAARHFTAAATNQDAHISDTDVTSLAVTVVRDGVKAAARMIEAHEARGIQREAIFLELLAPAARELGDAWEQDTLSFTEVTIGLGGLQQILRDLSPCFENRTGNVAHGRRAVLVPATGEQHSFGLFMVEAFFRRAGWDVVSATTFTLADVTKLVRREHFDVIGISKSCSALLDELASDITSLRRASCNKNVTIMVGGPAFDQHPERVTMVGADVTARDGQQAVWQANTCVKAVEVR